MSYFTFLNRFQFGTKVKSAVVNQRFDELVTAFNLVKADIDAISAWAQGMSGALSSAGGTLTGPLILAGDAAGALQPVPLQQLTAILNSYPLKDSSPSFSGLVFARTGGGGTAGVGIGRIFVQAVGDALPTGIADGDIVLQF